MGEVVVTHKVGALRAFSCAGAAEDEEDGYVVFVEDWGVFFGGGELFHFGGWFCVVGRVVRFLGLRLGLKMRWRVGWFGLGERLRRAVELGKLLDIVHALVLMACKAALEFEKGMCGELLLPIRLCTIST